MMLSKLIYKVVTSAWTMPGLSIMLGYLSARPFLKARAVGTADEALAERLSLSDDTLLSGYAENIQRSELAATFCRDKRVLDAGCGTGYGAHFIASQGAASSVLAVDVSVEAIAEAKRHYALPNLAFEVHDIQKIAELAPRGPFDVVVNFETISHLREPQAFLEGLSTVLAPGGTFVVSTPNGEVVERGPDGKPLYRYQFTAYGPDELRALLAPYFREVTLYGHFLTHEGRLRKQRARELFEQLCEIYYNPVNRLGRAMKRMSGKQVLGPPSFAGDADSFSGDYVIVPMDQASRFAWPPTTLIAVCSK